MLDRVGNGIGEKGKMMKKRWACLVVLCVMLCCSVFVLVGCSQLGQTKEEVRRNHVRTVRTNYRTMMEDIDKALLFDKPSKLTDKRIP